MEWIVAGVVVAWMLLSWYVLPSRGAFAAWWKLRRALKEEARKRARYAEFVTEYERTLRDMTKYRQEYPPYDWAEIELRNDEWDRFAEAVGIDTDARKPD